MKHIIWLIICISFAYWVAKDFSVEYTSMVDNAIENVSDFISDIGNKNEVYY